MHYKKAAANPHTVQLTTWPAEVASIASNIEALLAGEFTVPADFQYKTKLVTSIQPYEYIQRHGKAKAVDFMTSYIRSRRFRKPIGMVRVNYMDGTIDKIPSEDKVMIRY